MQTAILRATVVIAAINGVAGHGYMSKPKPRQVVYGVGPQFPVSSDMGGAGDVQNLNAGIGGGPNGQILEESRGHGLCGDISPRDAFMTPHQYGASPSTLHANAPYLQGDTIDVEVVVTAYHYGWFEFRLCDLGTHAGFAKPETQECFNEHVLKFDVEDARYRYPSSKMNYPQRDPTDYVSQDKHVLCDGIPGSPFGSCCNKGGTCSSPVENNDRWVLPKESKPSASSVPYHIKLILPPDVNCERCVLQWLYQTGNSPWNYPEAFWNCADISILPGGPGRATHSPVAYPIRPPTPEPPTPEPTTVPPTPRNDDIVCKAAGPWKGDKQMDAWCETNCGAALPYCPPSNCQCEHGSNPSTNAPVASPSSPPTGSADSCENDEFDQCGGKDYSGPTCCPPGQVCHEISEWYSNCHREGYELKGLKKKNTQNLRATKIKKLLKEFAEMMN